MKMFSLLFLAMLTLFVGFIWFEQVTQSAWCNDEAAHIPAGLHHLETGRMDAYRVNPPLPRMIAALPLLVDPPRIDWPSSESPYDRMEPAVAHQWVRDNARSLPRHLFLARSTTLLFFGIGLWAIVRWAGQMYGVGAAWLAGAMWSLNPDVITHSAVVAADLPAAATGLLAGYWFWNWLGQTRRSFPWSVAAVIALAILCKFSWLFLLPTLPLITLFYDLSVWRWSTNRDSSDDQQPSSVWSCVRDAVRLTLSFSLTLLLINWCYGFEGTATHLGDFKFISESLTGREATQGGASNRFQGGPLAWVPVPLPSEMVRGIDYLKWEFEKGMQCYLRGTWQHRGWWYFHLYAMAVKMPLGYWALISIGLSSLAWHWRRCKHQYSLEWVPILLAVLFVTLISSQTGFTHHVRYVLPAYGFLFLMASRVMVILPQRLAIGLAAVCLSTTVWFHATHPGLAHTYFNPVAGGPNKIEQPLFCKFC